jgi:hypothetical protein
MVIREATQGEYVANVQVYDGRAPAMVDVQLWDLRGVRKHVVYSRRFRVQGPGSQVTAFRRRLNAQGDYAGHNLLPANLLQAVGASGG